MLDVVYHNKNNLPPPLPPLSLSEYVLICFFEYALKRSHVMLISCHHIERS